MVSDVRLMRIIAEKSYRTKTPLLYAQAIYGIEEMLKVVNQSPFNEHIILKGGYLLSTNFGLENRSTRDLDVTIRGISLNQDSIQQFNKYLEDTNHFKITNVQETRQSFMYDGYKIKVNYINQKSQLPFSIDVTTGEALLAISEKQKINLLFSDELVEFYVYPLEQIIADKIYTTLSYGERDDRNSRTKDLYDIYFLSRENKCSIDMQKLKVAFELNEKQRGRIREADYVNIIKSLESSKYQQNEWRKFQENYGYANDISFAQIMERIKAVCLPIELSKKYEKPSILAQIKSFQADIKEKDKEQSMQQSEAHKDAKATELE